MNCEQANKISIDDFLDKYNFKSIRRSGQKTFRYSPFRDEKEPSFITNKFNQWHDFGSGEHGTLVDFVMKWQNCSVKEALMFIDNSPSSFSFHKQEFIEDSNIKIRNIRPYIKHKALLDYLDLRAIKPFKKIKNEIKEIWYTNNSKLYFGIAFKNDLGGYEMRSPVYKNCLGKKGITTILKKSQEIVLFEGFTDYLSYIILGWNTDSEDYLILNSTSMVKQAIPIIKKYKKIITYLDNDQSGKDCFEQIESEVPGLIDRSNSFLPYKDLNEFLMHREGLAR